MSLKTLTFRAKLFKFWGLKITPEESTISSRIPMLEIISALIIIFLQALGEIPINKVCFKATHLELIQKLSMLISIKKWLKIKVTLFLTEPHPFIIHQKSRITLKEKVKECHFIRMPIKTQHNQANLYWKAKISIVRKKVIFIKIF